MKVYSKVQYYDNNRKEVKLKSSRLRLQHCWLILSVSLFFPVKISFIIIYPTVSRTQSKF